MLPINNHDVTLIIYRDVIFMTFSGLTSNKAINMPIVISYIKLRSST
jgi:hypothetical protein